MAPKNARTLASIVATAGGVVVGSYRLRNLCFLLQNLGHPLGFHFSHRFGGLYSEEVEFAIRDAVIFGLLTQEEFPTTWGGVCLTYRCPEGHPEAPEYDPLIREALSFTAGVLDMVALVTYWGSTGDPDPWDTFQRLYPERCVGANLELARHLHLRLNSPVTPPGENSRDSPLLTP